MEFSDMVTPGAELVLVLRDGTRVVDGQQLR